MFSVMYTGINFLPLCTAMVWPTISGMMVERRDQVPAAGCLAFTTAVWMVNRVHGDTTIHRTAPQPAHASRLADGDVFVVKISHLADGGHAILRNFAGLARRQLDQRVLAFLGHQLGRTAGRAHHLRPLAGLQLNVVNSGTRRNIL